MSWNLFGGPPHDRENDQRPYGPGAGNRRDGPISPYRSKSSGSLRAQAFALDKQNQAGATTMQQQRLDVNRSREVANRAQMERDRLAGHSQIHPAAKGVVNKLTHSFERDANRAALELQRTETEKRGREEERQRLLRELERRKESPTG